jgi:hypothetical protein
MRHRKKRGTQEAWAQSLAHWLPLLGGDGAPLLEDGDTSDASRAQSPRDSVCKAE